MQAIDLSRLVPAYLLLILIACPLRAQNTCELFPIALPASALESKTHGATLPDIFEGTQPGAFGWLTWEGSPAEPGLVRSLTTPPDSANYVNPDAPTDRVLSIGDWVRGRPGVSNSKQIRDALDALKAIDITVPVWNETRGSGHNAAYHISAFARVRLLGYQLPGQNRISARFLGYANCQPANQRPIVYAGGDQSILTTETATLAGTATDDGLPAPSALTVLWSKISGPREVTFAAPHATNTTAIFDTEGVYVLRLTADDGALSASSEVTITVNSPNQPPVAFSQSVTNHEDAALPLTLRGADPENGTLAFVRETEPTHGVLSGSGSNLLYTPGQDFNGTDSFTFRVSDGPLLSELAVVSITMLPVNDAPVGDPQTISTDEDTPALVRLSGSDVDGNPLTYRVTLNPTNGALSGTPPQLTYTPAANYFGADSFSFVVNDGALDSLPVSVALLVREENDPPVAFSTTATNLEDTILEIPLRGQDVEGASLNFAIVTAPSNGVVTLQTSNHTTVLARYTPQANYFGVDHFTFRVDDGSLESAAAAVALHITPVNDPPVAAPVSGDTMEDQPLSLTLSGTDIEADALTFHIVSAPTNGTLTLTTNASHTATALYLPATNYFGPDAFTYRAHDGTTNSAPVIATINVTAINDAPELIPQQWITGEDTLLHITLAGADPENDPLTFTLVTPPAHGLLVLGAGTSNTIPATYTPAPDFSGADTFLALVNDGQWESALKEFQITVLATNDAPTILPALVETDEDTPVTFALAGTDPENDFLTFAVVLPPAHGMLFPELDGSFTYTPARNFFGTDSFTVIANDGVVDSLSIEIQIVVLPVNDPPTVAITAPSNDSEFTNGEPIQIVIGAGDIDGTIGAVTLWADGVELMSFANAPFAFVWTNAPGSFHMLTASATDNEGAVATSPAVTVGVEVPEGGNFTVSAGAVQLLALPASASLVGSVNIPAPGVSLTTNATWSQVSGPGSVTFSDATSLSTVASFSAPGVYVLKLTVTTALGRRSDTVTVDVLPAATIGLTATRSNRGKDFWLTFLSNYRVNELDGANLSLIVGSDQEATGEVTFFDPEYGRHRTVIFTVQAGTTTIVPIRRTLADPTLNALHSDLVQSNAIHLTASAEVSVYAINYRTASTDGYLALPTAMLGTNYLVLTYGNSQIEGFEMTAGTQFAIAASENNTTVTITPTITTRGRWAEVPYQVRLNQGETYRLLNFDTFEGDFTGTSIASDRPIAVFAGHESDFVPATIWASDHLVEQLPPVNTWGRQFATMPLARRLNGDTFRILASENDTAVSLNGELVAHLNRGEFHERIIDGPASITATKPVLVAQYAHGQAYDNTLGDPFMALVPASDQFGGNCVLSTPSIYRTKYGLPEDIYTNFVNLIVPAQALGSVAVNDILLSSNRFVAIGSSGFVGAQLPVPPGTHRFTASAPFGVLLYGWAPSESYAVAGGIHSDTIESGTTLVLEQRTATALVGTEKVAIARVTNASGVPVPDIEVQFVVEGANARTGRVITSRFGEATFGYIGSTPGVDVIVAGIIDQHSQLTNTWLVAGGNQPPQVDAGTNQQISFGETVSLHATATDDGQPTGALLRTWRTLSGPAVPRFSNSHGTHTTVDFDVPGTYELELEANDTVFSVRDTVKITVVPLNILPELHVTGPAVFEQFVGEWLFLSGTALDFDGRVVRLELYEGQIKVQETTTDNFDRYTFYWQVSRLGTNDITIVAIDDLGGRTYSAPIPLIAHELHLALSQSSPMSLVGSEKVIVAKLTDESGNLLGGRWLNFIVTGANPKIDYAYAWEGTAEATFVYSATNPGTDVIQAQVGGLTIAAHITNVWLLASTNASPVITTATASGVLVTNRAITLNGSASDDGRPGGALIYLWRVLNAAAPVLIENATSPSATAYFSAANSYQIEFSVSDGMFSARTVFDLDVSDRAPSAVNAWVSTNEMQVGQTIALSATVAAAENVEYLDLIFTEDFWWWLDFYQWSRDNPNQIFSTPYTAWRNGVVILSAQIYDWGAGTSASSDIPVYVGHRPTVTWITPANGQILQTGQSIALTAQTTDSDGFVVGVTYYVRNGTSLTLLGEGTGPQFSLSWTPTTLGTVTLVARATDTDGLPSRDREIQVSVAPPMPSITIVSPTNGAIVGFEEPITIHVSLSDPANGVTNVEFRVNDVVLASGLETSIEWTPDEADTNTLQVFADTTAGQRVASPVVEVIAAFFVPPEIFIVTPTNGSEFTVGSAVPVRVEAEDDGTNIQVSILVDGGMVTNAILADPTNGVFDAVLNGLSGWHSVTAHAVDETGRAAEMDEVRILVERGENADLTTPTTLTAQALSSTRIRLTWAGFPAEGAIGAIVERWEAERSLWRELDGSFVAGNAYTNRLLYPETSYRYRVALVDAQGRRSPYSAEMQTTTPTVQENYRVIDLTETVANTLLAQQPISNPMTNSGFNNFDQRRTRTLGGNYARAELGTNANAVLTAAARFKERWPQIQLDYDPALVTPAIMPRSGFLTGPAGAGVTVSEATANLFPANDPHRAVKAFLREHQALFGHGEEALARAEVKRDYVAAGSDSRTVVWQQRVAGVPVFNALLIGHITSAGELATLSSLFVPQPEQAADAAMLAVLNANAELPVRATNSLLAAVANAGEIFVAGDIVVKTQPEGAARRQTFAGTQALKGDAYAELTWFPARRTELRLAWQVIFASSFRNEMFLTLIAADNGEVLYRRSLTASAEASYRVYTGASPSPFLPGWSTPNIAQPPLVSRELVTLSALDTNASPFGWIHDADNETRGNNVDAFLDRNDDDAADARPVGSPSRVFDFPVDLTGAPRHYGDAATIQLFYWNNWLHDTLYRFGFTEAAGNFQNHNFARGGSSGDAVLAQAQDGLDLNHRGHVNNANMSTPPDGFAPRMQMYVFDGATPDRDGALDSEIVLHEYIHGLSGRLVGGGAGIEALATAGLGEGWSDFYALAMLTPAGADVDGVYPMGGYATHHAFGTAFEENYYFGIRRYPYCTDTNRNPLTFRDIDPLQAQAHAGVPSSPLAGAFSAAHASEVHRQGEVWAQMLWEVRAALIRKHGAEQGNSLAIQFVTDGMRFSPPNPNFVQARDAILLAERCWRAATGSDNAAEIWSAFAKRGLGFNAQAPDSRTTTGVRESYDSMPALAAERLEISGGNDNGVVDANEINSVVVHVRNQGAATATQVSAQLSSSTAGVSVLQSSSAYPDIPRTEARANSSTFQIQTAPEFFEGNAIDLMLVITSPEGSITNRLRLFTGNPNAVILYDTFSALGPPQSSARFRDLAPLNLGDFEPLWMAEDASCLLKSAGGYVVWNPNGTIEQINDPDFIAHRLTRSGVVVGRLKRPSLLDQFGNQMEQSVGVMWNQGQLVPLTLTTYGYTFPRNVPLAEKMGTVYNAETGELLDYVSEQPSLHDVWDLSARGQAAGALSVYIRPLDLNGNGMIDDREVRLGLGHTIRYDRGVMNWETVTERGHSSAPGNAGQYEVAYNALFTTAAMLEPFEEWWWVGPLSFVPGKPASSIASLINDAGTVGGFGAFVTGNAEVDAYIPTHAFRWNVGRGDFGGVGPILAPNEPPVVQDLGVLPGGLYSQPYALNAGGDMVGYSDFNQIVAGTVQYNPFNYHGVLWNWHSSAPMSLGSLGPVDGAVNGYSIAFAINDQEQIVGTSLAPDGGWAAVMWKRNGNLNGNSGPFWETNDLNLRVIGNNWIIQNAVGINNKGWILGRGLVGGDGDSFRFRAVLLVPASLTADVNRNRQLTLDDADASSPRRPFRFWINDDHDNGDVASRGFNNPDSPLFIHNHTDAKVNGRADVIDFFPAFLQLHSLLQQFVPARGFEFYLSQADSAVNFVYTDLTRARAFDYLTNTSERVYGGLFNQFVHRADAIRVTASGVRLNDEFLHRVQQDENKGVILIEGCGKTRDPLMLEIRHNGQVIAGVPLYLSIDGVEQMYRWLNLRTNITVESLRPIRIPTRAGSPANFPDSESNGRQFIYAHGFNVNERDSRGEIAEMYKRLWQSGSRAMFTGVSWFGSQGKLFDYLPSSDYAANVRNAFLTAPDVQSEVARLPGSEKWVAAHSLGNMLLSSAIVDHRMAVNGYFIIDGAVAIEAYDNSPQLQTDLMISGVKINDRHWREYDRRLWASEWHQLFSPAKGFTDDGRFRLTWRNRFAGIESRNVYNFYSAGEEVLENADGSLPPIPVPPIGILRRIGTSTPTKWAWVNQEMRKGSWLIDVLTKTCQGGWGANRHWQKLDHESVSLRLYTPEEANALSDGDLRSHPFFKPFHDEELFSPLVGNVAANDYETRAEVLGAGVPALTDPIGSNPLAIFDSLSATTHNFNLSSDAFQTGWPQRRTSGRWLQRWLHSDLKDIAYPFNHQFHDRLTEIGGLNQ